MGNTKPYFSHVTYKVGKEEVRNMFEYAQNYMSNELGLGDFDAAKTPILGSSLLGEVNLALCDPNVIQEIFTTKNDCVDKSGT